MRATLLPQVRSALDEGEHQRKDSVASRVSGTYLPGHFVSSTPSSRRQRALGRV
jgi:hypothetical protein